MQYLLTQEEYNKLVAIDSRVETAKIRKDFRDKLYEAIKKHSKLAYEARNKRLSDMYDINLIEGIDMFQAFLDEFHKIIEKEPQDSSSG